MVAFFSVRSYSAWKWFGDRVSCLLLLLFFSYAIQLFGMDKYWKKFSIHIYSFVHNGSRSCGCVCIECLNWWYDRRMNKLPQHMILGMPVLRYIETFILFYMKSIFSPFFFFSFFLSISLCSLCSDSHQAKCGRLLFIYLKREVIKFNNVSIRLAKWFERILSD